MDCSLPGSSVHGIFQARAGVGCHFLLQGIFLTQGSNLGLLHCRQTLYHLNHQFSSVQSLSHVWLFATPRTAADQAPPSMEFSRQEYWSGLPFPLSHRHIISKCTNYAYNNWPCQNVLQHLIECLEWQSIFEMLSYRKTLIIIVAENFQHSHQL